MSIEDQLNQVVDRAEMLERLREIPDNADVIILALWDDPDDSSMQLAHTISSKDLTHSTTLWMLERTKHRMFRDSDV